MDSHTIYGYIPPHLLKRTLYLGTIKGLIGFSLLFFGGFFFVAGLLCIAWGFIPYRRLKQISVLTVTDKGITYSSGQHIQFFPLNSIKEMGHQDDLILLNNQPLSFFSKRSYLELVQLLDRS